MENLYEKLLSVCFVKCSVCNCEYAYTVETADTDMASLYCSSVYDAENKQLIIAELTNDEYMHGSKDRLDKRINASFNTDKFKFIAHGWVTDSTGERLYKLICPYCGNAMSEINQISLREYMINFTPPILVRVNGETIVLKDIIG